MTKGGPGFGYGFIVAWAFVMSFFCLLCGLILQGFADTVEDKLIAHGGYAVAELALDLDWVDRHDDQ
jgi:hypothetical protein